MSKKKIYRNSVAFHPGSYVKDIIEDLDIIQEEFAMRIGATTASIDKLINGEEKLNNELAIKLSRSTGISLKTWINLQDNYDRKTLDKK